MYKERVLLGRTQRQGQGLVRSPALRRREHIDVTGQRWLAGWGENYDQCANEDKGANAGLGTKTDQPG